MAELSKKTIQLAIDILFHYDEDLEEQIRKNEEKIDKYEDKLNAYLVRISKHSIASNDNRTVSRCCTVSVILSELEIMRLTSWSPPVSCTKRAFISPEMLPENCTLSPTHCCKP